MHPEEGYLDALHPEDTFFADVDEATADAAISQLPHQNLAAFGGQLSKSAWHTIPTTYVICEQDHSIPIPAQEAMSQRVFEFDLSQTFSTAALTLVAIPILMIVLSMTLPARVTRITNLTAATLYIPITAFNAVGESWLLFYGLGVALELTLLAVILHTTWTWPHTTPASPDREPARTHQQA